MLTITTDAPSDTSNIIQSRNRAVVIVNTSTAITASSSSDTSNTCITTISPSNTDIIA